MKQQHKDSLTHSGRNWRSFGVWLEACMNKWVKRPKEPPTFSLFHEEDSSGVKCEYRPASGLHLHIYADDVRTRRFFLPDRWLLGVINAAKRLLGDNTKYTFKVLDVANQETEQIFERVAEVKPQATIVLSVYLWRKVAEWLQKSYAQNVVDSENKVFTTPNSSQEVNCWYHGFKYGKSGEDFKLVIENNLDDEGDVPSTPPVIIKIVGLDNLRVFIACVECMRFGNYKLTHENNILKFEDVTDRPGRQSGQPPTTFAVDETFHNEAFRGEVEKCLQDDLNELYELREVVKILREDHPATENTRHQNLLLNKYGLLG
jgi:hypothetical protein